MLGGTWVVPDFLQKVLGIGVQFWSVRGFPSALQDLPEGRSIKHDTDEAKEETAEESGPSATGKPGFILLHHSPFHGFLGTAFLPGLGDGTILGLGLSGDPDLGHLTLPGLPVDHSYLPPGGPQSLCHVVALEFPLESRLLGLSPCLTELLNPFLPELVCIFPGCPQLEAELLAPLQGFSEGDGEGIINLTSLGQPSDLSGCWIRLTINTRDP